ncbi:MAG: TIGR02449 family protein [Pseudohongiellaceae bacterium]
MSEDRFEALNSKIDALIKLCGDMNKENQLLKATSQSWANEKHQLLEKNKQAKSRLESILQRLKSLEEA